MKKYGIIKDKELLARYNLKINKKSVKSYYINSFDVETTGYANNFYLMGFLKWNDDFYLTYDKREAIKTVFSLQNNKNIVYATNLGFDFNSIAEGTDLVNSCNIMMNGQRYISVSLKNPVHNTAKVPLMDTSNYGCLSVESMGKILGLPKLKKPRCLGRHPKNKKEKLELEKYNKRDCEVTRKFMELIQRVVNSLGGELKCTISSCAMDIFRRSFLEYDVLQEKIVNPNVDWKTKIFKAYYGGRTEVFKRGILNKETSNNKTKTTWFYGDFASLYPSVMLCEYPNPMTCKYIKVINKNDYTAFLDYEGVSVFTLRVPYTKYPLLPYKQDEKLLFPYGYFKDVSLTHLEVREQLKLFPETEIIEMKDTVYYSETKKYFKNYVETLYSLRMKYKKEKSEMEIVVKMLLNSLYGKFAMKKIERNEFFKGSSSKELFDKLEEVLSKGIEVGKVDYDTYEFMINGKEEYEGIVSYPIWSVYVTAYARIKLHREIVRLKAVYCDTDSVVTDTEINDSNILGELKLEKTLKDDEHALIIKPKLYFWNDEIKSKGIPIPKTQKEKIRLINNIINNKTIKYKKFVKVKEGLRRHIKVNSIIIAEKNINLEDNKRVWKNQFNKELLEESEPIEILEVK